MVAGSSLADGAAALRRVLKNCATHHCKKEDWDVDYVPDEGEEGELPLGDEVQGWHSIYGAALLFAMVATLSWFSFKIYVAAHRGAERECDDSVAVHSLRPGTTEGFTTEYTAR